MSENIGASTSRRRRAARVSNGQLDALLARLETHSYLRSRKFPGPQGRLSYETGWKDLANELNQLPNGSVKTMEQWLTVWRDIKSRACTKAAKLKKQQMQTGNCEVTASDLTEIERRIISMIGKEYTYGTECPDSMLDENLLQIQLEEGVGNNLSEPQLANVTADESALLVVIQEDSPADQILRSDTAASPTIIERLEDINICSPPPQILASSSRANVPVQSAIQGPSGNRTSNVRHNGNLNPRRSVTELHDTARADFLLVAQSNAEAMKVLAAATQLQAEAAMIQANAAKIHAEAMKTQAEASLSLAEATNKIADAFMLFSNNYKN